MLRHVRIALISAVAGTLSAASVSTASYQYNAGLMCNPNSLVDPTWIADYDGLFHWGTSTGDAYCSISHPSSSFTPTAWQVRFWDRSGAECVRCVFFYKTATGGLSWGPWRFSSSTVGGTTSCSSPGYTGYNSLVSNLAFKPSPSNVAHAGFRCRVPAEGTGPTYSAIMGYRLTY